MYISIIIMKLINLITCAISLFVPLTEAIPRQHSCTIQYIQQQEKIVKQKCCAGMGACNTAPKTCSKECAVVFVPFYKKCQHFFDHSFYNVHYSTGKPTHIRKLQQTSSGHKDHKQHKWQGQSHQSHHQSHEHHLPHHHTKIPKAQCYDSWGRSCSILKRLNDCKSGKMASAMKTGCAKTCGTCRPKSNVQIMAKNCHKIYTEEVLNKKNYKGTKIPTSCTLWNDGCNNCGVNKGKLTFCSRMMCFRKQTPHCVKYKGITVVSKKPISKCDEIALANVLKGCETILKTDLRKMNKKMCQKPCVKKMVTFYNKCYNAPSLKNFFRNFNNRIIRPCEQGLRFRNVTHINHMPGNRHSGNKHHQQTKVGGFRDAHNCLLSAGYTWCKTTNKCARIWQVPCPLK